MQGFGNVGSHAAKILAKAGAILVGVNDHTGSICEAKGIDPEELSKYVKETGGVAGFERAQECTRDDFFGLDTDIFIPAALEFQIGKREAELLKAKVIVEGANGPTTPEGELLLLGRGIHIVPDILANAGGVIVSYFEWVQNKRSESWHLNEVDSRLKFKLKRAYRKVKEASERWKVDRRTAAFGVALERLRVNYDERGIFP